MIPWNQGVVYLYMLIRVTCNKFACLYGQPRFQMPLNFK